MAQINDPTLGGTLAVKASSRAARVTPVFDDGTEHTPKDDGTYFARLDLVPSTLTLGTVYFSMRNNGTTKAFIKKILAALNFAGTAAASRSAYEVVRFSGANMTGGTAMAAIKGSNVVDANSIVTDMRFAPAGLTASGVTFEANPIAVISHANQLTADVVTPLDFEEELELAPGEGLAIRASTAIVAGSALQGLMSWAERA